MPFPTTNCDGRLFLVTPSNGCTLTRASFRGYLPSDFESNEFKEIGLDRFWNQLREARMAGFRERTLTELLMSRIAPIKGELVKSNVKGMGSIIQPFISRVQRRTVNSNYWKVVSGKAAPGAGAGDLPASAWEVVVDNNPSKYGTVLSSLDKYFLPGKTLFIEWANATTNAAYTASYKILSAATVAGVVKVTLQPNVTDVRWAAMLAAEKVPYQIGGAGGGNAPTGTIAFLGTNSISDYESWKGQDPVENSRTFLHWFLQTSRYVHEYTDEYLKALNAAMAGGYFRNFSQLPLAIQKQQQQQKFERDLLNSVFYGQKINENQSVEGFRNLPTVEDPTNPGCVLEYKAQAEGFMAQLENCNRVLDHQGNPLNLDSLAQAAYDLKRSREASGAQNVDTIDFMTNRFDAGRINDLMISFYKAKYGVVSHRNYAPDEELKMDDQVALKYNRYQLPPDLGGLTLAVFWDSYFDDKLSAASNANRQRALWGLDWTDIEWGVAGTASAVRQSNVLDNLYNYVIKPNIKHVQLNSITWTAIVEDPNRHYVVRNFADACPTLTVAGCTV